MTQISWNIGFYVPLYCLIDPRNLSQLSKLCKLSYVASITIKGLVKEATIQSKNIALHFNEFFYYEMKVCNQLYARFLQPF